MGRIWIQLRTQVQAYLLWLLVRPKLFWVGILPLVVATGAIWICKTEQSARISGLALELLGIGTALWGLERTRKDFNRPSLLTLFRAWWASRPRHRKHIVSATGSSAVGASTSARGIAWTTIDPNAPLERQFAALCENVGRLRRDVTDLSSQHETLSRRVTDSLNAESAARSNLEQMLRGNLERAMADGLLLSLIGLVWVFMGTILTNMPCEASRFLMTLSRSAGQ